MAQKIFLNIDKNSEFPIQNLPYSVFTAQGKKEPSVCSRIGDYVIDLAAVAEFGFFDEVCPDSQVLFKQKSLNTFMAKGKPIWEKVRARLTMLLSADCALLRDKKALHEKIFYPLSDVILHMPIEIGDYTDFYSSIYHASNVGMMFRDKEHPLLPNYLHMPVGYHGRASSIVTSGTHIKRPKGQILKAGETTPIFAASQRLDFELEMAYVIGTGNVLGRPITIDNAYDHIFGLTLMNDWSARDIQQWEYVPLGPFLSKSFATTISPWIVPLLALAPFQVKPMKQKLTPLDYLDYKNDVSFDIQLKASLQTKKMTKPETICQTKFSYLYWTMAQQIAHHTINGCNLKTGDLMASGTISGPTAESLGCLLELVWGGEKPMTLSSGEMRLFLEDGDTVNIEGVCQGNGYQIGFGEAKGTVLK